MAKTIALVFGILYTVVGIVGFIPALGGTFGVGSSALLGLFPINAVHNVVHLVIGIPGLRSAGNEASAGSYLRGFGVFLVIVGILGIFWQNPFGILPIGGKDVWLHLITGLIFLWGGMSVSKAPAAA